MLLRFYWFGFAVCDGFCFCLQIDSGIEVCCVNGDVAKPVAYSVDVHATPEKMGCGRAPHRVWAHVFCRQGWHSTHGPSNGSFHQIINAEAGDWVAVPIQEDTLFRSARTIAVCLWCARRFLKRLVFRGRQLHELCLRDVEEVISWQAKQGYSRLSLRFYIQSLRIFLRYAEPHGWCPVGIGAAIVPPRVYREEKLPSGPSWPDVLRLIASTETNRPKDIRDRAILLLLAIYGLRIDEVRQLQLEDIDWEREQLLIRRSKERRPRTYPLSHTVGEAIVRYLQKVRPRCKDRTLFLRIRAPHRAFTAGGLWPIVGRRLRKLSIAAEHPGPHCLRHACATHLLPMGLSFKEIGDHLGHRSPDSTHIYAKVDLASLREVANFDLGGLL